MWQFAIGMYLVRLCNGELLLAAIFGFCGGGCVLLFGGIIGDWVDRNGRLKGKPQLQVEYCIVVLYILGSQSVGVQCPLTSSLGDFPGY